MKRILLSGLLLATLASGAAAQSELRGLSTYSYLGLGMPNDYRSSFGASMGVTGVALSNRVGTSFANPALFSNAYFTTAGGGLAYRNLAAKDQYGRSNNSQADALALQLVFPIVREKIGFSFGMLPVTENSYSFSNPLESVNGTDTIRYISTLSGSGGLNRLEAGIGIQVTKWLSIGYSPSLVLGTIRNNQSVFFNSIGYQSFDKESVLSNIGFGNRFGVFALRKSLFTQSDYVTFGAVASLPVDLNSDLLIKESQLINGGAQQVRTNMGRGKNQLPGEYSVGFSYSPTSSWLVAGEVLKQDWAAYKDFNGATPEYLKNRTRLGGGVQFIPSNRGESIFNRFLYRAGMSYDSGHLELSNTAITTVLFSAGLGIPSRAPGSSLDLSVDYGFRGTTSHDLVREQIFTFRVSFNLSELMFLQRKID
jgi:hypothetical protein